MALAGSLGNLSREDRALVVVACALAGRGASALLALLPPERAARLDPALCALLSLSARARLHALREEATGLAASKTVHLDHLHPERKQRALTALAIGPRDAPLSDHPLARAAREAVLASIAAPPPMPDEIAAAPRSVRALLRSSTARLQAIAEAIGADALRSVLDSSPPAVAGWLLERLPLAWEDRLARATPFPASHTALRQLDVLTRSAQETDAGSDT